MKKEISKVTLSDGVVRLIILIDGSPHAMYLTADNDNPMCLLKFLPQETTND